MSTSVSEVKHLIGTEWVPSSDGNTFESRDPHDGSLLATVARGDWALAAVDLTALALGAGFAVLARHSFVKARRPVVERKPRRERGAAPALATDR